MVIDKRQIENIEIEKLAAGEHELRFNEEDDEIEWLANSMRRIGVLVPLVVVKENEKYIVVAGHRRLRAAKMARLESLPCIVTKKEIEELEEVAFSENIFRKDLSPVEIAVGILRITEAGQMDTEQIARALQRSKEWVNRMLAMLNWPQDVLTAVHEGWMSISAGNNLALVLDDNYRSFLLEQAKENGATARTTAAWLQAWRSMLPPDEAIKAEPVDGQKRTIPACPQAPCICCGNIYRSDELSHVPACQHCIRTIREVGERLRSGERG